MRRAWLAWLASGVLLACGSAGTGGGTSSVGVPTVGQYEDPPSSSDPAPGSSDDPGSSTDPTGDGGAGQCVPCSGWVACTGGTSGGVITAELEREQDGSCRIGVGGVQGQAALECGGAVVVQLCSYTYDGGQPVSRCTDSQIGTWSRSGDGMLKLCASTVGADVCYACTPTDAPVIGVPGGPGRPYDAGTRVVGAE